jgi:hypothetical protein
MLALFVFTASGQMRHQTVPQPSLDRCFAEARKFVLRDPQTLGGVALGAGCVVTPGHPA